MMTWRCGSYGDCEGGDGDDDGAAVEGGGGAAAGNDDDGSVAKKTRWGERDKGLAAGDEGVDIRVECLSLGGDEVVPEGQQRAAPVVETAVGEPLDLGYEALRRRAIALGEGRMPSVFEIDLEDDRVYIDVPFYPLPTPPVQTSPSLDSSGSLPVSPAPSIVPSPISSPMIPLTVPSPIASPTTAETEGFLTELGARVEMQGGLICDHMVQLGELSLDLFERYDRDIRELFTRSGAVKN
ncbi:hypothetical protein Tco_1257684 [Tanacetum coccineum]